MIHSKRYDNSLHGGMAVMEAVRGNESFLIPLRSTALEGELGGPLADLRITQSFSFETEEDTKPVEAIYRFPLPGDAAVTAMEVSFGDTTITTELVEREEAQTSYDKAKRDGVDAAMLTRETADVHNLRITGIRPGEEVTVTTHIIQFGHPKYDGFVFRIPLTTAPRYLREEEGVGERGCNASTYLKDPRHRFHLDLVPKTGTIQSDSHPLVSEEGHIRLAEGDTLPDRDLVLRWTPDDGDGAPKVLVGKARRRAYLALLTPSKEETKTVPRDVLLLVDHSGSMSGAKWDAADWAVERFLSSLRPQDRFNICLFHSRTKWFSGEPTKATKNRIKAAVKFLKDGETGGTELKKAISEALDQPRSPDASRHLLVMTDGQVRDTAGVLRMVDVESQREDSRRCSVICIDSAPNDFLSRQMAQRSGGTVHFLTSDPNEGDITTALDDILDAWSSPLATNQVLTTDRSGNSSVRVAKGVYETRLPDMVPGRTNWSLGILSPGSSAPSFRLNGSPVEMVEMEAVDKLFSAHRVNELEILSDADVDERDAHTVLRSLGYSHARIKAVQERYGGDAVWKLMVEESLESGVLSCATAFIAEGDQGKKVMVSVEIPNASPHGWSDTSPCMMRTSQQDLMYCMAPGSDRDTDIHSLNTLPNMSKPRSEYLQRRWELFDGTVGFADGEAVLFDGTMPEYGAHRFNALKVIFDNVLPPDSDCELHLYIGDMVTPRVSVSLADMERNGGRRPVNIVVLENERVMVMLHGECPLNGQRMEVVLS